jgi:hypothetical protein
MDPPADAQLPRLVERRGKRERRISERRQLVLAPPVERRSPEARRVTEDRRSGSERRASQTAEEHVRNAAQLLTAIADSGLLDDELRRDLDGAIFRLHFALQRLRRDDG